MFNINSSIDLQNIVESINKNLIRDIGENYIYSAAVLSERSTEFIEHHWLNHNNHTIINTPSREVILSEIRDAVFDALVLSEDENNISDIFTKIEVMYGDIEKYKTQKEIDEEYSNTIQSFIMKKVVSKQRIKIEISFDYYLTEKQIDINRAIYFTIYKEFTRHIKNDMLYNILDCVSKSNILPEIISDESDIFRKINFYMHQYMTLMRVYPNSFIIIIHPCNKIGVEIFNKIAKHKNTKILNQILNGDIYIHITEDIDIDDIYINSYNTNTDDTIINNNIYNKLLFADTLDMKKSSPHNNNLEFTLGYFNYAFYDNVSIKYLKCNWNLLSLP